MRNKGLRKGTKQSCSLIKLLRTEAVQVDFFPEIVAVESVNQNPFQEFFTNKKFCFQIVQRERKSQ